jgi:hypothetical protein
MDESKRRLIEAAEKEQQILEQKRQDLLMRERKAQERFTEFQREKRAQLQKQQEKVQADAVKHHAVAEHLADLQQKKKEQILATQAGHSLRISKVLSERNARISKAKQDELARINAVNERRVQSQMSTAQLAKQVEQEDEETARRVAKIKHDSQVNRLKRIADRQLLIRIMDENAKALERRKAYESAEMIRKKVEREKKAMLLVELQQAFGMKRKAASIRTMFKRNDVRQEFREFLKEGGAPNLEALAERFNLDLDALKQKVEAGPRATLAPATDDAPAQSTGD